MITNKELWQMAVLPPDSTIQQAITNLSEVGIKIVLVANELYELIGTVSDGDIRRGLLKGLTLKSSISSIIHSNALVVPPGVERAMVMQLMVANKIQQIPVVDEQRRIVGLHVWNEINTPIKRQNLMVIMAGGKGARLSPLTENCPKPMLPVAGKPMLEHIIERAKLEGFTRFVLAIHYLGDKIESYFGSGEKLNVKIEYLREKSPLGTAGALGLLAPVPESPFVVTNGDVITDICYGDLLDFHVRHKAIATMAVRVYEWQHPFGVVQTKGLEIVSFEEKPVIRSHINAGVYVLNPQILDFVKTDVPLDMPNLFEVLQTNLLSTVAYPMHEPWLDVGQKADLNRAIEEAAKKV